jgi:lipooligosaccharide transport system ATP-binding protein
MTVSQTPSEPLLRARALGKRFGTFEAVKTLDLDVRAGECFGLLGPNGAGKSTFIGMTYGTVMRTSGELSVFGLDPATRARDIKVRLGVVTQENALDESLTVVENMRLYGAFVGLRAADARKRTDELLEYMNLAHKRDARIGELSGGMKRRLVFVRALLGEPELLILDEPTTGLDPAVRHLLWGKVRELHARGTTILITTHYMHEAEVLCDRLVIMDQGAVVGEGSPRELIDAHSPGAVAIYDPSAGPDVRAALAAGPESSGFLFDEDPSRVSLRAPSFEALTAFGVKHGLPPSQMRPSNLEDVFLRLTGKGLSDDA